MVKEQHENCHRRLVGLRAGLASADAFDFDDFIARWAHYEFDLYATREGRQTVSLMLRLSADVDVDAGLRRALNCSEPVVMQAFVRAQPALGADVLRGGWLAASGALYAAVTNVDETDELGRPSALPAARTRAIAFLIDGLSGYWRDAPRRAAVGSIPPATRAARRSTRTMPP